MNQQEPKQQESKFRAFFWIFEVFAVFASFFIGLARTVLDAGLFLLLVLSVSAAAFRIRALRGQRAHQARREQAAPVPYRDPLLLATYAAALVVSAFLIPRLVAAQPVPAGTPDQIGAGDGTQAAPGVPDGPVKLATVTSEPNPQPGQDNRSSTNFSTEGAPAGTTGLLWEITSGGQGATFNVMEDRIGIDSVIFHGVEDGTTTGYHSHGGLYIANPSGAGGEDLTVTVSAVVE